MFLSILEMIKVVEKRQDIGTSPRAVTSYISLTFLFFFLNLFIFYFFMV